jgi:uncharacterized protein (DUF433 family)
MTEASPEKEGGAPRMDTFRIAVETVLGALPDLDRPLGLDLVEIDQN